MSEKIPHIVHRDTQPCKFVPEIVSIIHHGQSATDQRFSLIPKDPFDNWIFLKRLVASLVGAWTYPQLAIYNRLEVEGLEKLKKLPRKNVLFIANHQTYFMDVIGFMHVASAVSWGIKPLRNPFYLLYPRTNIYYVAAEETMKDRRMTKLLSYVGALLVKRSWRHKGEDVNRPADTQAPVKIKMALEHGWVINFPQGTTKDKAPLRKGSAAIIKAFMPLVIPIVIEGFDEAFQKKNLSIKNKNIRIRMRIKDPLAIIPDESADNLLLRMKEAIEQ